MVLFTRVRCDPLVGGQRPGALHQLLVPGNEWRFQDLRGGRVNRVGAAEKEPGTEFVRCIEKPIVQRMERESGMGTQPFMHHTTCSGVTRAAGQRARHLESDERGAVEAQVLACHRAQERHAPFMKTIPPIEGGDPDIRVECQH